jgi:AraC-like DNA-binding protein
MDETGWSRRHLTARFRAQLGITPKAYGRVLRFRHAAELLSIPAPGRAPSLAEVAVAAGYYDQSHLNRDFVAMSGCTPGQFLAQADLVPEVRFVQDDDAP